MSAFVLASTLLGLFAAALVMLPFVRSPRREAADARTQENLAAFRERRAQLDAARAEGSLDEAGWQTACTALERALLEDTSVDASVATPPAQTGSRGLLPGIVLALLLLLGAALLYVALGALPQLRVDALVADWQGAPEAAAAEKAAAALLPALQQIAREHDPDGGYRFLLAELHLSQRRYAEADREFAGLLAQYPADAQLLAQAAQAAYLADGQQLTPRVQGLVDRTLALDPAPAALLALLGMHEFKAGNYRAAIARWETLAAALPAGSRDADLIRQGIVAARARLGEAAPAAPAEPQAAAQAAPDADRHALEVAVSVAPGLEVDPTATVFVFARAIGGPPMPLAVARFAAGELPRTVRLDASMAMAPGNSLLAWERVTVVARITRGGSVSAAPGDLEGQAGEVVLGDTPRAVELRIDKVL